MLKDEVDTSDLKSERNAGEDSFQEPILSLEEDAKYAAVINFCDHLAKVSEIERWEFDKADVNFVFDELLRNQPQKSTIGRLHMLWFVLGTACLRARKPCSKIIKAIDNATAQAISRDQAALCDLRTELSVVSKSYMKDGRGGAKLKRIRHLVAGKEKMVIAEARKVDKLHSLLVHKKKTYSRRRAGAEEGSQRNSVKVGSLVGESFWDRDVDIHHADLMGASTAIA